MEGRNQASAAEVIIIIIIIISFIYKTLIKTKHEFTKRRPTCIGKIILTRTDSKSGIGSSAAFSAEDLRSGS